MSRPQNLYGRTQVLDGFTGFGKVATAGGKIKSFRVET